MAQQLTGYPSMDQPWRKYYSEEEKNLTIPDGSMFDYLYARNKAYPKDIAMEYYGRKITYQELFDQIHQCCRSLSAYGVKKGDVVTVQSLPLPEVIILIYALNRIGACGNMLYPDAKAKDVLASMKKTQSKMLIAIDKIFSTYEEDMPASFQETVILFHITDSMSAIPKLLAHRKAAYKRKNLHLHTIPWLSFMRDPGKDYLENHDASIPAFMLRTGGTTGIPKEVVLSSRNFNAVAENMYYSKMVDQWIRQKTSLLLLPPFIAFGISSGVHHSLSYGTKLVIALDVSPAQVSKLFSKYKPNYMIAGTVQIEQMMLDMEREEKDLSYIEMLAVGGESMSLSFEEKMQVFLKAHQCNIIPIKGYGLTETTACAIAETMNAHRNGSVGIPLCSANMKVVDPDTGKEQTYDTPGEICLASPGVMQGYYQNPQATDEVIETADGVRWLHTGDIGTISRDGLLTITGRIKRIIICKEGNIYHKVFPLLLEDQLAKIDGVKEITLVGREDEAAGNVLVAFVAADQGQDFAQVRQRLTDYCKAHLESFETPVEYRNVPALPRTLIGKVDFRALEKEAAEAR